MKPILFEKNATDFSTFGLCRLVDAESCTVTEERNGAYELEMFYPLSGKAMGHTSLRCSIRSPARLPMTS